MHHIGSQLGFVQRGDGARQLLNSLQKISDQASCFPDYKAATFTIFTGVNSDTNCHCTVSCAALGEQNRIIEVVNQFHNRTTIRLVRHNSPPRGDYVHITGENSGCWSFVGRIGRGVSNRVQSAVKTSTEWRTAPLGFPSHPSPPSQRKKHNPLRLSRVSPQSLVTILQPSCPN